MHPLMLSDTLANLVTGLGTGKDKGAHSRFISSWLGRYELDAMYEGDWMAGRIIDAPVDDMTREWREWSGGPNQVRAMNRVEKALQVVPRVNQAMKLARLYGGAGIYLGIEGQDPSKALVPATVRRGQLTYITTLSRWELAAAGINRDPLSPYYGEPEFYQVSDGLGGTATIHPSRVVRFLGQAKLEVSRMVDGWGLSTLQRVHDEVRKAQMASGNLASLTNEAKVDVFKIKNLTANAVNDQWRAGMMQRLTLAQVAKSIANALIVDAAEEWDQKQVSFAGLVEVVREYLQIVAGAADMPVTRFLGTSPKGLNATGDSDFRNYYDGLASRQQVEVSPALERLDEVMIRSATGARPEALTYAWRPLWQLTEAEQAAIDLQRAEMAQIYASMALTAPEAMAASIVNLIKRHNTLPGLDEAVAQFANRPRAALIEKAPAPPAPKRANANPKPAGAAATTA